MPRNQKLITTGASDPDTHGVAVIILLAIVLISVMSMKAFAQETPDSVESQGISTVGDEPAVTQPPSEPDSCLACHGNPSLIKTLPSGDIINLSVNRSAFQASIHGNLGITCTECHTNIDGFPHPPLSAQNHREFTMEMNRVCGSCHENVTEEQVGSVHLMAITEGNLNAAVCSDCHGSHLTISLQRQRVQTSHTCQGCHSDIYNLYKNSVHGIALMGEGNPDVPNCISCHGSHHITGPANAPFRMDSTMVCAKCHNDPALMGKYDINTNVWDSWVSDFHGKTYILVKAVSPNGETDKALCIDCHGVHDMLPPENPDSATNDQNLIATCRKCHPRATSNFSTAWLDHYKPSMHHDRLVFFVTWFYRLAIAGILGGMALFVVSDYIRMHIDARKERKRNE